MGETYSTQPKLHRSGVTTVDASDPPDTSTAIDSASYSECRLDIGVSGTITSLEVQVLFWNPRQSKWFGGGKRTLTATGQHSLVVNSRGAVIFLKVIAFLGTSFSLSADYVLS